MKVTGDLGKWVKYVSKAQSLGFSRTNTPSGGWLAQLTVTASASIHASCVGLGRLGEGAFPPHRPWVCKQDAEGLLAVMLLGLQWATGWGGVCIGQEVSRTGC